LPYLSGLHLPAQRVAVGRRGLVADPARRHGVYGELPRHLRVELSAWAPDRRPCRCRNSVIGGELARLRPCAARKGGLGYAACRYSLIRPVRTMRRWTWPVMRSVAGGGFGGRCARAWCGR